MKGAEHGAGTGAPERRAHARIPGGAVVQLDATLNAGPGTTFQARVVDTSAGGTRLLFRERDFPRFHLGERVEVRFTQPGVSRALVALGQVSNQSATGGAALLGVRFTDRDGFYRQLTPELWGQFNRRAGPRAPLEVTAELQAGRARWSVEVHDLAAGGVALALTREELERAAGYELVQLFARLPGSGGMLALTCISVHQTPFGPRVRWGLRFDGALSVDLAGQQDRIAAHLRANSAV